MSGRALPFRDVQNNVRESEPREIVLMQRAERRSLSAHQSGRAVQVFDNLT
jgi:hypothetical protein